MNSGNILSHLTIQFKEREIGTNTYKRDTEVIALKKKSWTHSHSIYMIILESTGWSVNIQSYHQNKMVIIVHIFINPQRKLGDAFVTRRGMHYIDLRT